MLKRQRASSPIPSSSITPQDTSAEDIIHIRDLKRRRVAPPSLDGQTRGWTTSGSNSADENEEEYADSDGQEERNEAAQSSNAEYAAVNSVLKEIHILHKHRHLFSSSLPPQSAPDEFPLHFPADKNRIVSPPEVQILSDESARVYEHYEGTNRQVYVFPLDS